MCTYCRSLFYEADAGRSTFLEDVFENENRLPAGGWIPALTHWSDVRGDPSQPRDEIEAPRGWEWNDAWTVSDDSEHLPSDRYYRSNTYIYLS